MPEWLFSVLDWLAAIAWNGQWCTIVPWGVQAMVSRSDALVGDFDQTISKATLESRAAKGAAALTALGAGEPLALIMRNDLTQLEIMRATAAAGTVIVALNWHSEA